ncbi:MAG: arylesterase [Gallionella sp.]|nr:arylesterase [Gallionella sp.]MDP1939046.1 arylesterase [Gallionella sp.]
MKKISSSILIILKRALLLAALCLPGAVQAASAPENILVFGDSLSAGYGIDTQDSWPSLLQQEFDRSRKPYKIVNASISGETTLGGRQRYTKLLEQYRPAIVIVALGANDGLRGYSTTEIERNLHEILAQTSRSRAKVLLVGMKLPPNYGEIYTRQFQAIFPRLAAKHRVQLLPFLLEGVTTEQFQADYLHPAAASQPQIMRNVLRALKPLLR